MTQEEARPRALPAWGIALAAVAFLGAGLGVALLLWSGDASRPAVEAPAPTPAARLADQSPAPAQRPERPPPGLASPPAQPPPGLVSPPAQPPAGPVAILAAPSPGPVAILPAPSPGPIAILPAPTAPVQVPAEPSQPIAPGGPAASPEAQLPASPPLASEAELVALLPTEPSVFRLRENPRVFVLLFPTLDAQGDALNRVAALIEKAGLPRDRLLDDAELAEAVRRHGDTAATWYLGHDYNGTDLARFFAMAEREGISLGPAELWVRDRLHEARALVPEGTEIALISTANPDHRMDPRMRAAILRHEIGHGHFFTLPEFRAHVQRVWRERFRERDRQAFRTFLAREGYDTTNDLLMANEAMAYLIYTPDARFFTPRQVGMTEAEVNKLREALRAKAP